MQKLKAILPVLLISGVFTLLVLSGCESSDPAGPNDEPPEIPPAATFKMDFADFQQNGAGKFMPAGTVPAEIMTKQNWGWAAANIAVWNVVLTVNLVVPVAAFLESFNHTPVQQDDGSWLWSYEVVVAGVQHTAKLYATRDGDIIDWEMLLSKQNNYTDFEWFTGRSNGQNTEGSWTLNAKPADPTPYLGILWHRDPQAGSSDIQYTNIIPEHAENGGYIFAAIRPDSARDASYKIYNKGKDNFTDIEWNRTTKEGRVRDPLHFNDAGLWHCWDNLLEDMTCQ